MVEISLSGSGEGPGKETTRGYSTRSESSEEFRALTAPTMQGAAYSGTEMHTGRPYGLQAAPLPNRFGPSHSTSRRAALRPN